MKGEKPRVLIVEKSEEKRIILRDILRNGFQILEAENEREAAELLCHAARYLSGYERTK